MGVNVYTGNGSLGLDNAQVAIELPVGAGPRISGLWLAGTRDNLLAVVPHVGWETPWGEYRLRGGHRLWHGPESPPLTCAPDEGGVEVTPLPRGLRVSRHEPQTQLLKALEIELELGLPVVSVVHVVGNEGTASVTLAPWAITALPLGGTAILPPGTGLTQWQPDRALALWPGSSWRDPRLVLDDVVLVSGETGARFKLGQANGSGWAGYLRERVFLCKRFEAVADAPYADAGCNVEVFCDQHLLELETLGPLVELAPGEEVRHVERWELYRVAAGLSPVEAARGLGLL